MAASFIALSGKIQFFKNCLKLSFSGWSFRLIAHIQFLIPPQWFAISALLTFNLLRSVSREPTRHVGRKSTWRAKWSADALRVPLVECLSCLFARARWSLMTHGCARWPLVPASVQEIYINRHSEPPDEGKNFFWIFRWPLLYLVFHVLYICPFKVNASNFSFFFNCPPLSTKIQSQFSFGFNTGSGTKLAPDVSKPI